MPNLLEHRFAIKRITKPSNEDYISALKIYNETTPPDIKTNTNEITYWLEQNRNELPFEIMLFSLYLNNMVVGLAMLTYLKKQKTIIFEYLALQPSFRLNAVFFTYISFLVWLDIPINHVGAIIGNITSAIIATLSAIYFIKPKS